MKKGVKVVIALLGLVGFIGLIVFVRQAGRYSETGQEQQAEIPVEVMKVESITYDETLRYIGVVSAQQIQSLSFKHPGKLQQVFVEEGDFVDQGTVLASIDTSDVAFEVAAAKSAMQAAYAQYQLGKKGASKQEIEQARLAVEKARQVDAFKEEILHEYIQLYEEGVLSQKEYEQIVLEADVAQKDLEMATQVYETAINGADAELIEIYYRQYEQAKTQYEYMQTVIDDSTLVSPLRGTVVEIPYEDNTRIGAGTPVIHIRQEGSNILIGVTDTDFEKIQENQEVHLRADARKMDGKVMHKKNIPNPSTHLYDVEIYVEEKDTLIGQIVECDIVVGKKQGVWIPIQAVIVHDESYVFVYENGLAKRKNVKVDDFIDDKVVVTGLDDGDLLIVKNAKRVSDGKNVSVLRKEPGDD